MITHGLKIRRGLRSARASALSLEERREALKLAERGHGRRHTQPAREAATATGDVTPESSDATSTPRAKAH
jgi:hypothetical protein